MKPKIHMDKAANYVASIGRLDVEEDYEAILWASMQACTHWMNAIFHAKGLTSEDFDADHTWYLDNCPDRQRFDPRLDDEMRKVIDSLALFERLRLSHVRWDAPFGPQAVRDSRATFDWMRRTAEASLVPA